jgi:hypothetical protein
MAAGCAAISGLSNLAVIDDQGTEGGLPEGSTVGDGTITLPDGLVISTDGGFDANGGDTSGSCPPPGDCSNPRCIDAGWECVPQIPSGWNLVAFSGATRPSCPSAYPGSTDLVTTPTAASSCACPCTAQGANCIGATIQVAADSCTTSSYSTSSTCAAGSNAHVGGSANFSAGPLVQPTACDPTPASTFPSVGIARRCSPSTTPFAPGIGCAGGQACVLKPPLTLRLCVDQIGEVGCPTTWPNKVPVGAIVVDTRSCPTCSCASAPCSGSVDLYSDSQCTSLGASIPASGTCAAQGNTPFNIKSYKTDIDGGCHATGPAPQVSGGVTLAGQETVCCN